MDLYKNWACLLSAHGHGSVRPILQGPSGFIFILFKYYNFFFLGFFLGGVEKDCAFYLMIMIDPYWTHFFCKEIRIIFEFIFMDICPIGESETFESILYPNKCFQTIKLISKNFSKKKKLISKK